MLDFLDSIYPFVALLILLSVIGILIAAISFFGIKGIEIGSFEPKEKSVRNLSTFLKKSYVQIILVLLVLLLFIAGTSRNFFRKGTIDEIQRIYTENSYFLDFEKSRIDSLQLDFKTLSLVGPVREHWIHKSDSITFTIGNHEKQFNMILKRSTNDSLLYYVYIENYNYTSSKPYATVRKLK